MLKWFFALVTVAALCVGGVALYFKMTHPDPVCTDCNVILIILPPISPRYTSAYDPTIATTPFLAALAARSTVFQNAYAQASWPLPSFVSILTGRYPWEVGVEVAGNVTPPGTPTIAAALKANGYRTAAFVNGTSLHQGQNLDTGFDTFNDGTAQQSTSTSVSTVFDEARTWVETPSDGKPFFLLIAPSPTASKNGQTPDMSAQELRDIHRQPDGPTADQIKRIKTFTLASYPEAESVLADFLEALEHTGLDTHTVVLITSTNGTEFGEHGVASFVGSVYREAIHVPLIITMPDRIHRRILASVETRSIPQTILELTGQRSDAHFTAPSLVPFLRGEETANRTVLAKTAYDRRGTAHETYSSTALAGPLQVIRTLGKPDEGYDMTNDPDEQHDLLTTPDALPYETKRIMDRLFANLTFSIYSSSTTTPS